MIALAWAILPLRSRRVSSAVAPSARVPAQRELRGSNLPQLDQEVRADRRDFLRHRIARHFRSLPRQGSVSVGGSGDSSKMPWGGGAGGPLGTTPSTNPNANRWRGNFPNTPFEGSMRVPAIIRWPGAVPAAVVTNEMLSAVDRLCTLAVEIRAQGSADRRRRRLGLHARHEPYERPRQLHVLRPDGELMPIKWKGLQDDLPLHGAHGASRYSKRVQDATVSHVYHLSSDPHGDSNLSYRDLTCG